MAFLLRRASILPMQAERVNTMGYNRTNLEQLLAKGKCLHLE